MKVEQPYIKVFCSSETANNPYKVGNKELLAGLYCETVIKTKKKLLISNALKNEVWNNNPDIKLGMISYLGFPLFWPDEEVFGTICVLDLKENSYTKKYEKLIRKFKELVETHLELLYHSQKLETFFEDYVYKEKLATLGILAEKIGHEIRNPLGVINNSIYYLTLRLKNSDEKIRKHLKMMQKEVERSNKLVTHLLNLTSLNKLNLEMGDINLLIKEFLEDYEFPTNIALKLNLDYSLPLIEIDRLLIHQVFQNIIKNSVEAMPNGGNLGIKTKKNDSLVEIIFKDSGMGIPKINLYKIFNPLFSTKIYGIGLGLTLVKNIIELHEGEIGVESESDIGTTITIRIPFGKKENMK